jgi:CRP/FNR family transcriptional regulator, cyclic AMP receptor protein
MPCDVEILRELMLFEFLEEADLQQLSSVIETVELKEGEVLFESGDPGDSLFVVQSGEMEIFTTDTAGQKIVLANPKRDDIFGELALLDSGPRSATAKAVEEAMLLVLDREHLLFLIRKRPEAALKMLAGVGSMTRKADELLRTRVARNANEVIEIRSTPLTRAADLIAEFSGSMPFLILNGIWFFSWIVINVLPMGIKQFDPFPFGLLTMIVSLEAIFLSCFVLISQNRQAEKDHLRSDIEYDVNIKAELEIQHLHEKSDRMNENVLARLDKVEKLLTNRNSQSTSAAN